MIQIAIVEDEPFYVKQLKEYLERYEAESRQEFKITVYTDGYQIIDNYKAQFDIILMDVEMKHVDGMTAAEKIRETDSAAVIIFITNMAQYAIKGYAVDALDYVLKPVSYFAFTQRLKRAISRMKKREEKYITIVFRGGAQKLNLENIFYVEIDNHDLIYHTAGGDHVVSGTMKSVEEELVKEGFFRCNKCYLVNLRHVEGMKDGCAIVNGEAVLISRARKSEFLEALSTYMRGAVK